MAKDGSLAKALDSGTSRFLMERDVLPILAKALRSDSGAAEKLIEAIETGTSGGSEEVNCALLGIIGSNRALRAMTAYFDKDRFPSAGGYAISQLLREFSKEVSGPEHSGWIEVHPQAKNDLRSHLFSLAITPSPSRLRAIELLMDVELTRLSSGRPPDEPRHPNITSNSTWPNCLFS
jgi:hypothetical protein